MKLSYQSLEDNLNERESFFSKREGELQELHRSEIAKGEMIDREKSNKLWEIPRKF